MYYQADIPVNILYKSIAGRHRPVRVADGPITGYPDGTITAYYRFIKNASWDFTITFNNFEKPRMRKVFTSVCWYAGVTAPYVQNGVFMGIAKF